jgi:hypothetical protein
MSLVNAIINQNQYVLAPSLQMFFIDPISGQPLTSGTITFYRDIDRTQLKPVYVIGGTPTDPTFIALPNPVTLDLNGIFIDNNNGEIVLPYYDILDENGNIDLYYIVIQDQYGSTIETLEHFPQINSNGEPTVQLVDNLIANGQFLFHENQPNGGLIPSGTEITPIAYGGWRYVQTPGSSSINYVNFLRYGAPSNVPDQNPRYAVQLICTLANPTDTEKNLEFVIPNANFLQGQDVTFQITAYSNDGNNHNVNLIVRKYFGFGGSPDLVTTVTTFLITPQIQNFTIPFTVSSNIGETLNPNDDDQFIIALQSPLASISNIIYTDAIFVAGIFSLLLYPPIPYTQDAAFSLAGSFSVPAYNGAQNGALVQLGINGKTGGLGFQYIGSSNNLIKAGMHFAYAGINPPSGFLSEDGASYAVQAGGALPVYPDLFNVIFSSSQPGSYTFGSGVNGFFHTIFNTNTTQTFWNRFDIAQPAPNPGTSGFTFTLFQSVIPNSQQQAYNIQVLAASAISPGAYFILPVNTTGPVFMQLFWFTINGVGAAPAVTFDTVVTIALLSTDTATNVRDKIIQYANGLFQVADMRNNMIRYWNNTSPYDTINPPLRNYSEFHISPTSAFVSYISGNFQNNIGSSKSEINSLVEAGNITDIYYNAIVKY